MTAIDWGKLVPIDAGSLQLGTAAFLATPFIGAFLLFLIGIRLGPRLIHTIKRTMMVNPGSDGRRPQYLVSEPGDMSDGDAYMYWHPESVSPIRERDEVDDAMDGYTRRRERHQKELFDAWVESDEAEQERRAVAQHWVENWG